MCSFSSLKRSTLLGVSVALLGILGLTGCQDEETSLFEPVDSPAPEITAITPADSAEAGSTITVEGRNFLADPEANYVYFEGNEGTIESASATELEVTTPEVTGDTVEVRAATRDAVDFSNVIVYKLY